MTTIAFGASKRCIESPFESTSNFQHHSTAAAAIGTLHGNLIAIHSVGQRWLAQTQTWLYDLVRFLPEGVESHVVCRELDNLEQFALPNIHSRTMAAGWWRLRDKLERIRGAERPSAFLHDCARRLQPSIIHSHFAPQGWADRNAAISLGIPHLTSFYGYDVHRLPREDPGWSARYQQLFAGSARILCEGPHMAKCIENLGCPSEKITIQRLGVDVEAIPFEPRVWSGACPLRVLLAAAFREKKGLPLALEALARLPPDVDLEITLVGAETDAPGSKREADRIEEVLARTGLAARTTRTGFIPHAALMGLAMSHHMFLSPSLTASDGDTEGGAPVSLIQLAATGIVVVTSDHCDIPGVVRAGETGYLAAEGCLESLTDQLLAALEAHESWDEYATAARRHIRSSFNARSQGRRLARVYQETSI